MAMESELQLFNGFVPQNSAIEQQPPQEGDQNPSRADEAELLWKLRKYVILLAVLSATITYQAGLAPPGGLWPDNQHGHLACDIVLQFSYPERYKVFFYCNTTAFMASLIILTLLLVRELSSNAMWPCSLQFAMLLDLFSLMGACASGSCREVRTSLYTWVLLAVIFLYIALHVVFFRHLAPELLRQNLKDFQRFWEDSLHILNKIQDITDEPDASIQDKKEELEQNRSSLLVLATLAATVTYAAGLSPPGGF